MIEGLMLYKPYQLNTRRWVALFLLILVPLPISLPLALWITRGDGSSRNPFGTLLSQQQTR
jgi:hypothetical protein